MSKHQFNQQSMKSFELLWIDIDIVAKKRKLQSIQQKQVQQFKVLQMRTKKKISFEEEIEDRSFEDEIDEDIKEQLSKELKELETFYSEKNALARKKEIWLLPVRKYWKIQKKRC